MENIQYATLAAGCFWCVEAIYKGINGILSVESGYSNGDNPLAPSYKEICTGTTGYAEVIRISFDTEIINYETVLDIFWHSHNPTTLNRQGNDVGTQYRSAIFTHNDAQKEIAQGSKQNIEDSQLWADAIVTEITPLANYHIAEDYHQDYFAVHGHTNGYCNIVVAPKVKKVHEKYAHLLKH